MGRATRLVWCRAGRSDGGGEICYTTRRGGARRREAWQPGSLCSTTLAQAGPRETGGGGERHCNARLCNAVQGRAGAARQQLELEREGARRQCSAVHGPARLLMLTSAGPITIAAGPTIFCGRPALRASRHDGMLLMTAGSPARWPETRLSVLWQRWQLWQLWQVTC